MSGCARVNAANDCRYALATCWSHSRTVTTVFAAGRPGRDVQQHRSGGQQRGDNTQPSATNVENRGRLT